MPFLLTYTDIRALIKSFSRLLNAIGHFSRYTVRIITNLSSADQQSYRKKFMQVGMAGVGTHTREMCFKIQKNPNSLISSHTLTYLVHKTLPTNLFAAFD